jgi:hypothetical protein
MLAQVLLQLPEVITEKPAPPPSRGSGIIKPFLHMIVR